MIEDKLTEELTALEGDGCLRSLKELGGRSGKWIDYQGQRMLNLSSNDYMGYAGDKDLVKEFYSQQTEENLIDEYGPGSSASRLLSGNHTMYSKLEDCLEALYGKPGLVFTSGYHANIGVLSAMANRDDLILVDRLAHASILDGVRLTNAEWQRYPHLDMDRLREMLAEKRSQYRRVFIVTESIFSMDGDMANLQQLVDLKKEFDLVLYVDEAHAVGVRGEQGLGVSEETGLIQDIDIIIGTFGKALGGLGAFAVCASAIKEYLINKSRSFIFTTALPPVVANWNHWILQKMSLDSERRVHLSKLSDRFRSQLVEMNIPTAGSSHIVPAILGENQRTVDASSRLAENGFMALAVRPPTVPKNTSRIRFSLSATMVWDDLSGIFPLFKEVSDEG